MIMITRCFGSYAVLVVPIPYILLTTLNKEPRFPFAFSIIYGLFDLLKPELSWAKCNIEDLQYMSNLEVSKLIMYNMIVQGLLVTEYLSGGELFSR